MSDNRDNKVQIWRSIVADRRPADNALAEGELFVELASAPPRLWAGAPGINTQGRVQIGGGGAVTVSDTAPTFALVGDLWWCSLDGNLYVYFDDGSSKQWVVTSNPVAGLPSGGGGGGGIPEAPLDGAWYGRSSGGWSPVLPLTGGTLSGTLELTNQLSGNAAVLKLTADTATPAKFLRSFAGNFEVINSAYSAALLSLTDAGNLTLTGGAIVGGAGISYAGVQTPAHYFSFAWTGSALNAYVDNTYVGTLATTSGIGAYLPLSGGTITGELNILDNATGASASLGISAPNNVQGAGITLTAGSAVAGGAPGKTIRSMNGNFEVVNSAYNGIPLQLTDSGNMGITGWLQCLGANINGNTTVSGTIALKGPTTVTGTTTLNGTAIVGGVLRLTTDANIGSGYTPVGNESLVVGWNLGTGNAEVDFLNCYTNAVNSFAFRQWTGSGWRSLVTIDNQGTFAGLNVLTGPSLSGMNIKLVGDGTTTPNKYLRSSGGRFQVINHGYSSAILDLDDAGNISVTGGASLFYASNSAWTFTDSGGYRKESIWAGWGTRFITASAVFQWVTPSNATLMQLDGGGGSGLFVRDGLTLNSNITLHGDTATPNKFLRSSSGQFQIINNAFSAGILTLTDAGDLWVPGGLTAVGGLATSGAVTGANVTGTNVTGTSAVVVGSNTAGSPVLYMNGAPGTSRAIYAQTAGRVRWLLVPANTNPESGGNAGSDFGLYRYDDNGNYLGSPLGISRATGQASFAQPLTASGGLWTTSVNASGNVTAGSLTISGALTGPLAATGGGVTYPDLAAAITGPPSHAFGFVWDGSSIRVYVDGSFQGRMALYYPLAEEMEARLVALEDRLLKVEQMLQRGADA